MAVSQKSPAAAVCHAYHPVLIFAVRAAHKQNRYQAEQIERLEDEQRERDADRRREQASKVALWWVRGIHDELPYFAPREMAARSEYFDRLFDACKEDFHFFTAHGPSGDMAFIEFTDIHEQRWRRDLSGRLTLLGAPCDAAGDGYPAASASAGDVDTTTKAAAPDGDPSEVPAEPKPVAVCPHCVVAFDPSNDFCPTCGAALERGWDRDPA